MAGGLRKARVPEPAAELAVVAVSTDGERRWQGRRRASGAGHPIGLGQQQVTS